MICFAVCLCHPHGHAGEVTAGTRRLCRKLARPIFSVRICVARELSAFGRPSCMRSLLLLKRGGKSGGRVCFGQPVGFPAALPLLQKMAGNCL